jgi:hypothetical protein
MALKGMNGSRGWEAAHEIDEGSLVRVWEPGTQFSMSFSASSLSDEIAGDPKDNRLGLGYDGPASQGGQRSGGHR